MSFYKKTIISCTFLAGLSACYADVETPKLSDMPPPVDRKQEDVQAIYKELEAAKEKNKMSQQHMEEQE